MSRGLGATQRAILAALPADGALLTVQELAEITHGRKAPAPPSRARMESVRRALLALGRQDLVELHYMTASAARADPRYGTRRHLAARLPPAQTGGTNDKRH